MPVLKYRPNESSSWQTVGTTVDGYSKEETDALLQNKADISSVYTKTESDTLLQDKADTSSVYTKGESDTLLQNKADTSSVYTKAESDTLLHKKVDKDRAVNPNLLDNWYFGNPVNQRQGRIVVPNTTYYSDNTLATAAGTTSAYVTAYRYATGTASGVNYASFKLEDSNTAPTYYAAPENVVRGYTSAGYGIDRWLLELSSSVKFAVELNEGFIRLVQESVTETDRWQTIIQKIGNTAKDIAGKVITVSLLHRGTGSTQLYLTKQNTANAFAKKVFTNTTDWQVSTLTATVPDDATDVWIRIYADITGSLGYTDIMAVKLELGSQQTLAHQDDNGVWVLNEIPDYGEQLARCQRYFYAFNFEDWSGVGTYWGKGTSSTGIELYNLTFPITMRVNPSVKMLRVYDTINGSTYDVGTDGYYNKKEGLRAIGVTSGMTVTVDRMYIISKAQFSADL